MSPKSFIGINDWKFWFAIIGAIISAEVMVNKLDQRLTRVETKMDFLLTREGIDPAKLGDAADDEDDSDDWYQDEAVALRFVNS